MNSIHPMTPKADSTSLDANIQKAKAIIATGVPGFRGQLDDDWDRDGQIKRERLERLHRDADYLLTFLSYDEMIEHCMKHWAGWKPSPFFGFSEEQMRAFRGSQDNWDEYRTRKREKHEWELRNPVRWG